MNIVKIDATFHSSIDKVWELLTDLNHQLWRRSIEKVEIIDQHRFIEYDKDGYKTEFVILNKIENDTYEFNMMNQNMEGHWIGKLKVLDDGLTYLEMTEAIQMKKKMMSFIVKKYLEKQQKQYIEDLKMALGE